MIEKVIEADKELFFTLNALHTPFLDKVMVTLSAEMPWVPLYIGVIFFLFFSLYRGDRTGSESERMILKRKNLKYALFTLLAVLITFSLTDSVSGFIKDSVERFRPAYDPVTGVMVRLLEHKGSLYGFLSSHASNTFGFAMITSLIFRNRIYTFSLFTWAALVSYSRIYVGKHYPLDVICGAILGILIALLIHYFLSLILRKSKLDK
ncbi:MAG: phosphatase PAP2 family protein [Bacteroidales bacterium]|nr:phosphatase PAP2 family protein [Bacteroidales bacterium]MDD2424858.1 phosphatase PAP2 family protein [Bacteroidales bacterium]MDD3990084.1 phosphatase PAP2 family protein [Bacteroidales bacterium]MDD4639535.1 phosphatase PAP2 family protein [Bacteroidales bacterium]